MCGCCRLAGEPNLLEESLTAEDGGQLGAQQLERHHAAMADVVGEVNGRHSAGAQLPLDRVAACEGGGETALSVGQQQRTPFPLEAKNSSTNSRSVSRGGCPATRQCSRYAA